MNALAINKIRDLQKREGFEDCFQRKAECKELTCCWRELCKTGIKPLIKWEVIEDGKVTNE